jgi:hypothetical protein
MESRVWNRGTQEYREEYKSKIIVIPAGQFILMDTFMASDFRGKYPGKGVVKMLEIEDVPSKTKEPEIQVCNLCGLNFITEKQLFEHLKLHNPEDKYQETEEIEEPKAKKTWSRRKKEVLDDSSADTINNKSANR